MTNPQPSSLPHSTLYRVEAVILRHRELGEADRLLTLYTREHGKLRATVRGARKLSSRLGGHVQPLTHVGLVLVRGRTLDTVTQAQEAESFNGLRADLPTMARSLYLADLVDSFTEEQEPQETLFELLLEAFRRLDRKEAGDAILRAFEVRFLEILGYRPELRQCASCSKPLGDGTATFGAAWGGLLCMDCRVGQEAVRNVTPEAVMTLRRFQSHGFAASLDPSMTAMALSEAEGLARWYIQYLLERPLESASFLDEVRKI